MRALLMTLSAPLRSWGGVAVGDTRPSEWAPTQAAVIGLLGAVVGLRRNDPHVAEFYAGYDVWAASGPKVRRERGEAGGLAFDFQTIANSVGGDGKPWDDTIVSRRGYLADWVDVVAVVPRESAPVDLAELATRMDCPTFAPYLGRKAFPLSAPLIPDLVELTDEELARQLWERWLSAGGDREQGQMLLPAGTLSSLPGFRMHRLRRSDVRKHYGFAERTVQVWRPRATSISELADAEGPPSAATPVVHGQPPTDAFDYLWEPLS